jgi:hypothetical protein
MDLIMGGFADASIASMTDSDLDELERLLDVRSGNLFLDHGEGAVPAHFDTVFFRRMRDFANAAGMRAHEPFACRCPQSRSETDASPMFRTAPKDWCVWTSRAPLPRTGASGGQPCGRVPRWARMAALSRGFRSSRPISPSWNSRPGIACRYDPRVAACRRAGAAHDGAISRSSTVKGRDKPSFLLTTVNAASQRVPPRALASPDKLSLGRAGQCASHGEHHRWLELNGYMRASTVREPGDYAVRGGILDLFPPGLTIRCGSISSATRWKRSAASIRRRSARRRASRAQSRAGCGIPAHDRHHPQIPHRLCRAFGAPTRDDQLYEAVSEGRRYPGMEHWLPLFHDRLDTLFDYLPDSPVVLEPLAEEPRMSA